MKTVNHFPNLNSYSFHASLWESATIEHQSLLVARIYSRKSQNLISDCQNLASTIGFQQCSTASAGIRWHLAAIAEFWQTRFRPNLARFGQNGQIWPDPNINLAKMAGIRPNLTGSGHWFGQIRQLWPDVVRYYYLSFVLFLYKPNTGKYFRQNHFFLQHKFCRKYFTT